MALNSIEKLRIWCQKVLPLVYDDSLSYYEVLTKVVNKLNEVIALAQEQNETIEEALSDIETFETDMSAQFETYKTTLDAALDAFETEITTQQSAFEGRMTQEFADFLADYEREFGITNLYGDSITLAISQNQVSKLLDYTTNNNRFNPEVITSGKAIDNTGAVIDNPNTAVTGYIEVQPGENIVAQAKNNTTSERYQGAGTGTDVPLVFDSIAGYDEDLTFVSGSFKSLVFNYQVPVGVKYIKIAMGQTILDGTNTDMSELAIVNSDGTIYPYQPYSEQNATVKMNALPVDDTQVGNHLWSANKINAFQEAVQAEFTQLETDLTGTVQGAIGDMNTAFTQKSAELDTKFDTLEGSIQAEQEAFETEIEGALASQKSELETDIDNLESTVTEQIEQVSNHFIKHNSINLFDPDKLETGVYCNSITLNRSVASAYNIMTIPVTPGTSYVVAMVRPSAAQATGTAWRFVVFADSNMNGLSVLDQDNNAQYGYFTTPANAAYAIISYYALNTDPLIMVEDPVESWNRHYEYTSYEPEYDLKNDIKLSPNTLGTHGLNIINKNNIVHGQYVNGGTYINNETYCHSELIEIEPQTTYYSFTGMRFVCHYDSNKRYLSEENADNIRSFTTSANDKYVIITFYESDANNLMVSDEQNAAYEEYKKVFVDGTPLLNSEQKADMIQSLYLGNTLKGKKWVACGDSFTADGGTGTKITEGKYKGQNYVYPYIIGNRTDIDVVLFAGGGRTLGYLNDPDNPNNANSLTCPTAAYYYRNIPEDADYITIYLGINDANYNIPVGTINDEDSSTYMGAYNEVLTWLIQNRPFAHIGIIVSNGVGSVERMNAQIAIAQKYGIPYLNMNGDQQCPAMIRSTNPNIPSDIKQMIDMKQAVNYPSNTHPNDATHLYESTFIENFIRSI